MIISAGERVSSGVATRPIKLAIILNAKFPAGMAATLLDELDLHDASVTRDTVSRPRTAARSPHPLVRIV